MKDLHVIFITQVFFKDDLNFALAITELGLTFKLKKNQKSLFKVAGIDTYFAKSKFPTGFRLQEKFWLDMTSSLQVRILILSRELG